MVAETFERRRGPRYKLSLDQVIDADRRHRDGLERVEDIAISLGVTKPTLYSALRRHRAQKAGSQ